ncbi:MAG: acyl-CoA dehydrogenase family protein [Archangium sp.]|nr:acyl-CoA dehydrogenase family protein [Archangium sp.]MDP3570372.1 acyl-CoA dehydrogenase family protein [Archangium sp.]
MTHDELIGGGFLLEPIGHRPVMAPEFFSPEQRALYETARRFSTEEVLPRADRIEKKDFALLRELLRKAGELGLLGIDIEEAYGGFGLDKTTTLVVAEAKSLLGSWSVTFAAHTCIGTLPIAWFGTHEQKQKYLPTLASGEKIAAYALTEAGSGSDALGAKTRAVKSADGTHYLLTGSKQYITNAGFADVFIVFAKVDGAQFSCFIVDRDTPGLTVGPEEHKMGIRGSSTCPLILEDARVPVGNLLGEIGRGHKIAFNILNLGRLKLGAGVIGAMKLHLGGACTYTSDRRQFDTPIIRFGLTREKLARMLTHTYAVESMAYRTSGLIDDKVARGTALLAAIEEFAVEASILKILGSEYFGQLVDDGVQLHGGAGFIEEYPVERAYRDARINRIFEGTNEINRLLIGGTLLKRAMKGVLPLFDTAGTPAGEDANVENLKRLARLTLQVAVEAHGPQLEKHQGVLACVADLVMDAFALDAMTARNRQLSKSKPLEPWRVAAVQRFSNDAHGRALLSARRAMSACVQGDALKTRLAEASALIVWQPLDAEVLDETLASAVEAARGYPSLS